MVKNKLKSYDSIRERNRDRILIAAESVFAKRGFKGARVSEIAEAAKLPKANLLYYFRTKEEMYRAVIRGILEVWLSALGDISVEDDPTKSISRYIKAKMELSCARPNASKVFAMEIISGAPIIGNFLRTDLREWVIRQSRVFSAWQKRGEMDQVAPEHVFFVIWAMTQTYADFDCQIAAVLGKDRISDQDYTRAIETVTTMVLAGLGIRGTE